METANRSLIPIAGAAAGGMLVGLVAGYTLFRPSDTKSASVQAVVTSTAPAPSPTPRNSEDSVSGVTDIAVSDMRLAVPGDPSSGLTMDIDLESPPPGFAVMVAKKRFDSGEYTRLKSAGAGGVRVRVTVKDQGMYSLLSKPDGAGTISVAVIDSAGRLAGSRDVPIFTRHFFAAAVSSESLAATTPERNAEPSAPAVPNAPAAYLAGPDYHSLATRAEAAAAELNKCLQPQTVAAKRVTDFPACAKAMREKTDFFRQISALPSPPGPFPLFARITRALASGPISNDDLITLQSELWGIRDKLNRL